MAAALAASANKLTAGSSSNGPVPVQLIRIGDSTKARYAKLHEEDGVSLERLTADRAYKNAHRQGLTDLYESLHTRDPTFELRDTAAIIRASSSPIIVVVDVRMRYELSFLRARAPPGRCVFVRIIAGEAARTRRGVKLVGTVPQDSHITEVDLDGKQPDLLVDNSGDDLGATCALLRTKLAPFCSGAASASGRPFLAPDVPPLCLLQPDMPESALAAGGSGQASRQWARPLIVCVESTIAGGKSTLLRLLQ